MNKERKHEINMLIKQLSKTQSHIETMISNLNKELKGEPDGM